MMLLLPLQCNGKITGFPYPSLLVAAFAAFLLAVPLSVSATILQFTLNTSSLSGTAASLAFDFLLGDGAPGNNTAVIGDFSTDGDLGDDPIAEGGVSGSLIPGPLTLTNTILFNSFLQPLTFGTTLSFTLTLTEQSAGGEVPDSFSFSLLDTFFAPLFATTDDPDPDFSGGALFQVDIDGSPDGILRTFAPVDESLAVSWTVAPVAAVPEPSTVWLLGAGLLGGLMARRWRVALQ